MGFRDVGELEDFMSAPTPELAADLQSAPGDLIVLTIGEPIGKSGGTNTMKIVKVGEHRKS